MQSFIKTIKYAMAYREAKLRKYVRRHEASVWAKLCSGEEWLGRGSVPKIYKALFNYINPATKKLDQEMAKIFLRDFSEPDIEEARRAVHLVV